MISENKIPLNWEVKKIGELTKVIAGGTPSTTKSEYWGGKIKWMNSGELNLKFVYEVEGRITDLGLKKSSTKLIPKKCILIGLAGQGKTRGTVAMNMIELCTNQSIAAVLPSSSFYEEYIFYYLESKYDELRQISTGDGGRGGLNLTIINSIKVLLPPTHEQQKIAQILSTWDKAIQETNDIIKALEKRNKVLGNNLLNNETWEKKKLKALFTRIIDKNSEGNQNVTTISARHGFIKQNQFFNKTVASENLSGYYLIKKDDFCYNKSYSNGYDWGVVKRLNDFEKAVVTTLYICFRLHATDQNIDFWELYFANNILDKGLSKIAHEGGRAHGLLNVTANDFFSLKIGVPTIEEQNKIAKILSIANEELQQYKQKLENIKLQKKGLMQQLLTGKLRTL